MMAEQADQEIYIYKGGRKEFVPRSATHIRVHDSVKVILEDAFYGHRNVVEFECHDGVERIMGYAFFNCTSLKRVKIPGVTVVEKYAFGNCVSLTDVVDCDKLETIGKWAFHKCKSLTCIKMPSIETVEVCAFNECKKLNDVECGDKLERFGAYAFSCCTSLKRITIPLKDGMIPDDDSVFQGCLRLKRVDLVGGTHKTIVALQLEDWRKDMNKEFDRINYILPNTRSGSELHFDRGEKTQAIRIWITSVLRKIREIEFYKAEHRKFLKEASTTLELAVWKSRLCGDNNDVPKGDEKKRAECRNNCGADMSIIISNVLSFLTKIGPTEIEKYVSTRAARCRFELFGF